MYTTNPTEAAILFILVNIILWFPICLFYRYVWPGKRVSTYVALCWLVVAGVRWGGIIGLVLISFVIVLIDRQRKKHPSGDYEEKIPGSLTKIIKEKLERNKDWIECPKCSMRLAVRKQDILKSTICPACNTRFRIAVENIFILQHKPTTKIRPSFDGWVAIILSILGWLLLIVGIPRQYLQYL